MLVRWQVGGGGEKSWGKEGGRLSREIARRRNARSEQQRETLLLGEVRGRGGEPGVDQDVADHHRVHDHPQDDQEGIHLVHYVLHLVETWTGTHQRVREDYCT